MHPDFESKCPELQLLQRWEDTLSVTPKLYICTCIGMVLMLPGTFQQSSGKRVNQSTTTTRLTTEMKTTAGHWLKSIHKARLAVHFTPQSVIMAKREMCVHYETRICGLKNFSRAWIDGSSNHRTSNITDHANSGHTNLKRPHKFKAATMYFCTLLLYTVCYSVSQ